MIRSLTFKWVVTLLLSSLTGVTLVGLFAYRTTVNEFDRLRVEQIKSTFMTEVTTYYQDHGSWDGINEALGMSREPDSEQRDSNFIQVFALTDTDGVIVLGIGPYHVGEEATAQQLSEGIPVTIDEEQVGTVLLALPPPRLDPREQVYVDRTNQALFIGAIGASAIALLIGILLSRQFLRPLSDMMTAIAAMRRGELKQQVPVRSQDELGELAQSFNEMSVQLHQATHMRKQKTADIAHDLRTPLMVISGYLEALRDGTLSPTQARFDTMNQEVVLLKRLTEDLRTLSLADAGELKLIYQPVPPRELLEQVKQSFEPIADEEGITLKLESEDNLPDVNVDRERMVQVLGNLVSNALRYTPSGGTITLRAQQDHAQVRLIVSDTGTGIAEDKLANIFDRFYRTEESRHQDSGESGLGLAIAKSIVEAHHGVIVAESRLGAGTSLIITLQPAHMIASA
ncbi:MAG: HAMP domain-containing protein [Anaerolineae bacterium]|nr:HAMP domain-containing protein [Anaerolineae bacterium]